MSAWTTFYPPPRRKSSASSLPPSQPIYSSVLAESPDPGHSPFQPYSPVTPGLDTVAEADRVSSGSRAPLLKRDFATTPDREHDRAQTVPSGTMTVPDNPDQSDTSFVVVAPTDSSPSLPVPIPSPPKRIDHVPPPSIHDTYVSRFITPIAIDGGTQPSSPVGERPPIFRAASAPGVPLTSKLLPSPLPSGRPADNPTGEVKPIFEIFDAGLNVPAQEMVKALKGHLEEVLKVQEEIGRMHLGLEKLVVTVPGNEIWEEMEGSTPERRTSASGTGTPGSMGLGRTPGSSRTPGSTGRNTPGETPSGGTAASTGGGNRRNESEDVLLKREKGVEEIMERLGILSDRLQTYHTLGTPRLSFPHPTISPTTPTSDDHNPIKRPRKTPKTPDKLVSPPPLAVANLRGQVMPASPLRSAYSKSMTTLEESGSDSRTKESGSDSRNNSETQEPDKAHVKGGDDNKRTARNSNLSPLSLSDHQATQQKGWWGDEKGEDTWVEQRRNSGTLSPLGGSRAMFGNGPDKKGKERVDSPLEMADRSRPW